jgi:hypothetical protein
VLAADLAVAVFLVLNKVHDVKEEEHRAPTRPICR